VLRKQALGPDVPPGRAVRPLAPSARPGCPHCRRRACTRAATALRLVPGRWARPATRSRGPPGPPRWTGCRTRPTVASFMSALLFAGEFAAA